MICPSYAKHAHATGTALGLFRWTVWASLCSLLYQASSRRPGKDSNPVHRIDLENVHDDIDFGLFLSVQTLPHGCSQYKVIQY